MSATVVNDSDEKRYEVFADGRRAGMVEYRVEPGTISFVHTEIDSEFEGEGLGSTLVRHVLDDARARRLRVQPLCSFVRHYIAEHGEYLDLVPDDQRERFGL
jgi:hypothetical protein